MNDNTVYFANAGELDIRALKTFGVSAKESDNPIGQFGTGLKYAIAVLLRNDCEVSVSTGNTTYLFKVNNSVIRGQEFGLVEMCYHCGGEPCIEELAFTTDLGKNWEPWQAYRELVSNAWDESGDVYDTFEETEGTDTVVRVQGAAIAEARADHNKIFIGGKPKFQDGVLQVFEGAIDRLYYQGIRACDLKERKTLYTYNVITGLDLTEDRTIKHVNAFRGALVSAVLGGKHKELVRELVTAPKVTWEAGLDIDSMWETPNQLFMETMADIIRTHNGHINPTAIAMYRKHSNNITDVYEFIEMDQLQTESYDRAVKFCTTALNVDVTQYEVKVTRDLPSGTVARAHRKENMIVLGPAAFEQGPRYLASTLWEEFIHLRENLDDCSRGLQDYLFNKAVHFAAHIHGEP